MFINNTTLYSRQIEQLGWAWKKCYFPQPIYHMKPIHVLSPGINFMTNGGHNGGGESSDEIMLKIFKHIFPLKMMLKNLQAIKYFQHTRQGAR